MEERFKETIKYITRMEKLQLLTGYQLYGWIRTMRYTQDQGSEELIHEMEKEIIFRDKIVRHELNQYQGMRDPSFIVSEYLYGTLPKVKPEPPKKKVATPQFFRTMGGKKMETIPMFDKFVPTKAYKLLMACCFKPELKMFDSNKNESEITKI